MPFLINVLFLIAGFLLWFIAQRCLDPLINYAAAILSSPSRLQPIVAMVFGPACVWALDYKFTIWICAIKRTFLDDPYTTSSPFGSAS
ncbi:hypothetical protein PMAYCL1PPCAC_10531 [Pristionchus mayeri]|uniref:Uncharacterized protein n=1 Tax=Pristionchus mayeri TaxID=1317129 RepID=A0AAN4ZGD7_9BILA|nr:hypothetical protein PMAYCL1PPCAC_10531 [Pristionchus mayeri]